MKNGKPENVTSTPRPTEKRHTTFFTEEMLLYHPACGSGNFLYVAYRELVNLEMEILAKIHENFGARARKAVGTASLVSTKQLFGIDKDSFAVELAKVTVMLGKRIALAETHDSWFAARSDLPFSFEDPLPLDNLDNNIRCDDALFSKWPDADFIIGNPPYQSKNKMQQEYGRAYLNRVRDQFPDVPGRADYCVYWFRKAHNELQNGERAGLVGTNTIRQNYSREGGLDHIVNNGGTITEAVSTQVWSGDAVVHVSIVNWLKGEQEGKKKLFRQLGDNLNSPWQVDTVDTIGSSLSGKFDVTKALEIRANKQPKSCDQGQTQGHEGFLLLPDEALSLFADDARNREVIFPYLIADDILGCNPPSPQRYIIDFHPRDLFTSRDFTKPFARIESRVLPTRKEKAEVEEQRNADALAENPKARVNHHHRNFLNKWWSLSYPRGDLMQKLIDLPRYIACGRVTKRPVFVFVSSEIHPGDALQVFTFADDYSFGVLQSSIHWNWFIERCSTLKREPRYTSNTVYDSFPWPQSPTPAQIRAVAKAAVALRQIRWQVIREHEINLRELYGTIEAPGKNPLRDAHQALDLAVRKAYKMPANANVLEFLFALNQEVAEKEESLGKVTGPGLPPNVTNPAEFINDDCIKMP